MKISIITPVFNREDTLLRCLESVTTAISAYSTDIDIEHMVVDDGSTDSSVAILNDYAGTHEYITPIVFTANKGVAAARNAAIAASTGDYCLFLDSDDWLDPEAFNNIAYAFATYPDQPYYMFMCDDRMAEFSGIETGHIFTFADFLGNRLNGDFSHLVASHIMKKYPFDEQLRIFEAFNHLKCQREARNVIFINRVMTHIERNRCDSVSLTYVRTNTDVIARKLRHAIMTLAEFGDDYRNLNLQPQLSTIYMDIADNSLLLADYSTAREYLAKTDSCIKKNILSCILTLHAGKIYRKCLQLLLSIKHKMPERGVH